MKEWTRRIRGALGMGLTWGVAWFLAGMVVLLIVGPDAADVPFPLGFGLLGFLAGTTFSGIVALVERSRRFDQISIPRFAGWGAVGGLAFCGLFVAVTALAGESGPVGALPLLAPVFAAAGAGCAAGSLALARRARDADRLRAGTGPDEPELTDEERRELLGEGS